MPDVEGGDLVDVQALSQGNDARISAAEGEICVLLDQIGGPREVRSSQVDCLQLAGGEGA